MYVAAHCVWNERAIIRGQLSLPVRWTSSKASTLGLPVPGAPSESMCPMNSFLLNNRDELIARCKAKVAQRPRRGATPRQLRNGVPLFLDQLTRTLEAEQ